MVSTIEVAGAVSGHQLSTVVPGSVTAENTVRELTGGDLAVKLHYLRAVYYFGPTDNVRELTVPVFKEPMFNLLDIYYAAAGRIRLDDAGRPYIRCNDGGVRIVEARCDWTVEEWLGRRSIDGHRPLVPEKVVGPDVHFSPTVFIQFTRFKCGGMAVGLSWAHLLGDPVSASNFMNLWGQLLSRRETGKSFQLKNQQDEQENSPKATADLPLSVKQVEHAGDTWLTPNSRRMATFSVELKAPKLGELRAKIPTNISTFETISALIWQVIAKIRTGKEPEMITVCRNSIGKRSGIFSNQVKVNCVKADSSPANSEVLNLAKMINKEAMDEMRTVQELVDREGGNLDVVLYGSNLTFVDMESINLYALELRGQRPVHVDYSIHGVGDEGAVLVLQGPVKNNGRVISFILPEEEIPQLQELLENDWDIA